jgi:membrane associated rhomboid family serine protease
MGFENRDYFRDGSYTGRLTSLSVELTPVVKYLILTNVIVFLLQIFLTRPANMKDFFGSLPPGFDAPDGEIAWEQGKGQALDKEKQEELARKYKEALEQVLGGNFPGSRVSVVQEWFDLNPRKTILQGQVWRLVTSAFCHDRYWIWHIVLNMLLLYWFGTRLESMYGSREFLLFYLAAAVASSLAYVGLAFYTGSHASAIGASGAVMGVMALYAIFYPFETVLLFWFLPVPIWLLLSAYVIFDLHPVLLALSGTPVYTGVAHAGHLGGLAFGWLYWRLGLRLEAPFDRDGQARRRPRRRPRLTVYNPPPVDSLDDMLDQVLRKISEKGQGSLTEQEREILIKASAKYREGK